MALRPRDLVALFAVALVLGGCASTDDSTTAGTTTEAAPVEPAEKPSCRKPRRALTAALVGSLTAAGSADLRGARYVQVKDPPDAPLAGFREGVYVVSARLEADGIDDELVSFAVSRSALRDGGGLVFPLDAVTREFSDFGSAAAEGSPAREYADAVAETGAYDESRDCVGA